MRQELVDRFNEDDAWTKTAEVFFFCSRGASAYKLVGTLGGLGRGRSGEKIPRSAQDHLGNVILRPRVLKILKDDFRVIGVSSPVATS